MSEQETFLARWSRRKLAAGAAPADAESCAAPTSSEQQIEGKEAAEAPAAAVVPHAAAVSHDEDVASAARGADATAPLFDPASLPPIESIAADTDIRAFLAPGVPPELARAALRRAWTADPKIRDFVGLADYDWDFNAPGSMAGFGPLEMTDELREIAARMIGPPPLAEPSVDTTESFDSLGKVGSPSEIPPGEIVHDRSEQEADAGDPSSQRDPLVAAAQNRPDAAEESQLVVRPRHGGALPK
jgi:Protein of unknown function (DUF3306)